MYTSSNTYSQTPYRHFVDSVYQEVFFWTLNIFASRPWRQFQYCITLFGTVLHCFPNFPGLIGITTKAYLACRIGNRHAWCLCNDLSAFIGLVFILFHENLFDLNISKYLPLYDWLKYVLNLITNSWGGVDRNLWLLKVEFEPQLNSWGPRRGRKGSFTIVPYLQLHTTLFFKN